MTTLPAKQLLVDALLAGKLAIGDATCTCKVGEGCDEEGEPGCAYCRSIDCEWPCPAEDESREHLLPVAQVPICVTCGGSGSRLDRVRDHGSAIFLEVPCDACRDGLPLALTLTVEVPGRCTCGTSFDFLGHLSGCEFYVLATQRPVARVQVTRALPIIAEQEWTPEMQMHPAVIVGDASKKRPFADWPDLILYTEEHGSEKWGEGTNISHLLLPGVDWSGTALIALIVTGVEKL